MGAQVLSSRADGEPISHVDDVGLWASASYDYVKSSRGSTPRTQRMLASLKNSHRPIGVFVSDPHLGPP